MQVLNGFHRHARQARTHRPSCQRFRYSDAGNYLDNEDDDDPSPIPLAPSKRLLAGCPVAWLPWLPLLPHCLAAFLSGCQTTLLNDCSVRPGCQGNSRCHSSHHEQPRAAAHRRRHGKGGARGWPLQTLWSQRAAKRTAFTVPQKGYAKRGSKLYQKIVRRPKPPRCKSEKGWNLYIFWDW